MKWNHIAQNNLLGMYNGIILPKIRCYVYKMESYCSK